MDKLQCAVKEFEKVCILELKMVKYHIVIPALQSRAISPGGGGAEYARI